MSVSAKREILRLKDRSDQENVTSIGRTRFGRTENDHEYELRIIAEKLTKESFCLEIFFKSVLPMSVRC